MAFPIQLISDLYSCPLSLVMLSVQVFAPRRVYPDAGPDREQAFPGRAEIVGEINAMCQACVQTAGVARAEPCKAVAPSQHFWRLGSWASL